MLWVILYNLRFAETCINVEEYKNLFKESGASWQEASPLQYEFLKSIFYLDLSKSLPPGNKAIVVNLKNANPIAIYYENNISCALDNLTGEQYRYFKSIK